MKILSVDQIRAADAYTIANEPIASIDLMERASEAFVEAFVELPIIKSHIRVVCGCGNNAGDGMAIARLLHERNFDVEVWVLDLGSEGSKDFIINRQRWSELGKTLSIGTIKDLPDIDEHQVLIDAIFGSGLNREISGVPAQVIRHMNESAAEMVAVDIPSGLFADQPAEKSAAIVCAAYTLTFQNPKLAFLLPENDRWVGDWQVLDIGLSQEFLQQASTDYFTLEASQLVSFSRPRNKFAHKGTFGHALLISGSKGKIGATVLSSKAALRCGLGLLTVHIPVCGYSIMQITIPEAMIQLDEHESLCSDIPWSQKFNCAGLGPGLGTNKITVKALKSFFQETNVPLVIDADALNIISEHRELLEILPANTILTPHPKEFERLAGNWTNDFERLQMQRQLSADYKVIVVVKGAHTAISFPDGAVYFNTTGNPGMGTAGSGDVLTGMLTGLLARTEDPGQAALTGVFVHGYAGDLAAQELGEISMIAGDIIDQIGPAFKRLGLQL